MFRPTERCIQIVSLLKAIEPARLKKPSYAGLNLPVMDSRICYLFRSLHSICKTKIGVIEWPLLLDETNWCLGLLRVSYITDVKWNDAAFDTIVLEEDTKKLVKALVTNMLDQSDATDIISGKGNGLVILLHG